MTKTERLKACLDGPEWQSAQEVADTLGEGWTAKKVRNLICVNRQCFERLERRGIGKDDRDRIRWRLKRITETPRQ